MGGASLSGFIPASKMGRRIQADNIYNGAIFNRDVKVECYLLMLR
jgi:hypothetical protein